jgi:predicted ATPase/class 3 adenylate cyclase
MDAPSGEVPSGPLTFMFTDLEGSTRTWETAPSDMPTALARHFELLSRAVTLHGGRVLKTMGDGLLAVFPSALGAIRAAAEIVVAMERERETALALRARVGIHSGHAHHRAGDYYGPTLNRASRLMAVAHAGQVLVSLATARLLPDVLPGDLSLQDLGEHRLRDVTLPVHVFQLSADGMAADFPPLKSVDLVRTNIPAPLSRFVGRNAEQEAVLDAVGRARLVTLTGLGGVGKTRLALRVGSRLVPDYPDGVWVCELASAGDQDAVSHVIASALAVSARPGLSLLEAVAASLRLRQLVLVLDNCEHVVDAARAAAGAILSQCPSVRVLATSRVALGLPGELLVPVGSLPTPEPGAELDAVVECDSVQLFADRGQGVRPGFTVDGGNIAAVAHICRCLDGIPLAVELAAARLIALTPAQIAGHLDERFQLLTRTEGAASSRHQTLRSTIDWSFDVLTATERSVFSRLGVFTGSFDAEDALGLIGDRGKWEVLDALTALVTKSLISTQDGPDDAIRYVLLDTLRHYALERLAETDDVHVWRRRHCDHFARVAETVGVGLRGPDELTWRPRLEVAIDNLRAAVSWSLDSAVKDDHDYAVTIVAALAQATVQRSQGGFRRRQSATDVSAWAERAVAAARRAAPPLRTAVLGAAAWSVMLGKGDMITAEQLASDAMEGGLHPDCPAPELAPVVLGIVPKHVQKATEFLTAVRHQLEAVGAPLFAHVFVQSGIAYASVVRGDAYRVRRDNAREALHLARELGNPSMLASALFNVAHAIWREDPAIARALLDESATLTQAGASGVVYGFVLGIRAQLRARAADIPGALEDLREAIAFSGDKGDRIMIDTSLDRGIVVLDAAGGLEAAAVVAGAVTAGRGAEFSSLPRHEISERRRTIERLRAELDPARYEDAFALGASMNPDAIVDFTTAAVDHLLG